MKTHNCLWNMLGNQLITVNAESKRYSERRNHAFGPHLFFINYTSE